MVRAEMLDAGRRTSRGAASCPAPSEELFSSSSRQEPLTRQRLEHPTQRESELRQREHCSEADAPAQGLHPGAYGICCNVRDDRRARNSSRNGFVASGGRTVRSGSMSESRTGLYQFDPALLAEAIEDALTKLKRKRPPVSTSKGIQRKIWLQPISKLAKNSDKGLHLMRVMWQFS